MKIIIEPLMRRLSLFARAVQSSRKNRRLLNTFLQWKSELLQMVNVRERVEAQNKILIIRLDDIGDYLLFRNTLDIYRKCDRFKSCHITLLGNASWKGLFEFFDAGSVDKVIWVNKKQYRSDLKYRKDLWEKLSTEGYKTVICPSRTRPLLLDDLCALAARAESTFGAANSLDCAKHDLISNNFYTSIFSRNDFIHEYEFNQLFAGWCCQFGYPPGKRPIIKPPEIETAFDKPYLLFCVGTTAKSRRWPIDKWIDLMQKCRERFSLPIVLESGSIDTATVEYIQSRIKLDALTGRTTLPEVAGWIGKAAIVFAHDSMAAHLSVCCQTPTVIIANGMHYHRFTSYRDAGISNVATVLPRAFIKWRKSNPDAPIVKYTAVTSDISTIAVADVLENCEQLRQLL